MTATRVGKVHAHRLPDEHQIELWEVYRCECNKEFFRGRKDTSNEPSWIPLDAASHYVEYGEDQPDAPLIGRWVPEKPGIPRPPAAEESEVSETEVHDGPTE